MTDWEDCYQRNDCPWDKGVPSPGLVDFLETESHLTPGTVCVPGCGMGHDARQWATHGFEATGVDISPTAMDRARQASAKTQLPLTFETGDFLNDTPAARYDWVFEHTFFCAIAPDQRDPYVEAVTRWLKPGGRYLAVYYLVTDPDGPPFPSTREEIHQRFLPSFDLLREWVPRSFPNRTDLELMVLWSPKAAKG